MKKIIANTLAVISAIFFVWVIGSFLEVSSKNNIENHVPYSEYNFFIMLTSEN